jgi:hypothetical protein
MMKRNDMAVPTPDAIYNYIRTLHADGEHIAMEWAYLVDRTWRYHSTTSNAVDKRMRLLVEDERLARLRVDCSGLVFLPEKELQSGFSMPHFAYHKPHEYAKQEYGTVSLKRGGENLWVKGVRYLYMTRPAYDAMITNLVAKAQDRLAGLRNSQEDERTRRDDALTALAPDALEVCEQLRQAVPGIRVEPRLSTVGKRGLDQPKEVNLSIDMYEQSGVVPLLDIIRRGLLVTEG